MKDECETPSKSEPEEQYQGWWIPPEIVQLIYSGEVSSFQLVLLATINNLVSQTRGCYASNAYLAKRVGLSESRVSHMITDLLESGLLIQVAFNGRQRYLETVWSRIDPDQVKSPWLKEKLDGIRGKTRLAKNSKAENRLAKNSKAESLYPQVRVADIASRIRGNKVNGKKHKLSPATPADGECSGFPFPGEEATNGREISFAARAAKYLYNALARKRRIKRKPNLGKWAVTIKKYLVETGTNENEFKSLLVWYAKHICHDQWMPRADSAESFCDRYVQIEDARARLERPVHTEEDEIIYDPLYIPATKEGRERKARQMARAKVSAPAAKNRNA